MKLKVLGIDSKDFDRKRMNELKDDLFVVFSWIGNPGGAQGRERICEAASILDKLVTRDVPLTQYRGLAFEDLSLADALLGGKVIVKYPCESWTSKLGVAEVFVEEGPRPEIKYVMKRTFSKNEIILDTEGLALVLKALEKELKIAIKQEELHSSNSTSDLQKFFRPIVGYVKYVSELSEFEFLVHPRPYTPKDILKMKIDEGYDIDERTPNLLRLLGSHPKYLLDELIGKWLHMKAGKIVKVG